MKILIFGIPGSGKTQLARKVSRALRLPIFHIDKHFFKKGWLERDHDHFLEDVKSVLKKDNWIIDGNGMRTLEMRYKEATVAIYCKLPRLLCLFRIFYRWLSTLGKAKDDGPEGATNSISWKLIKYLWNFPNKYQEKIEKLNLKYPEVNFLEILSKGAMNYIQKNCQETIESMHVDAIRFELLKKDQEEMLNKWLHQDYIAEFWHGVGLQNTLKSISRFVNGEETLYTLWIAYDGDIPFGYLMTSKIDFEKDHLYAKYLNPSSKAITLDLLIGNPSYLGRGLGHRMIKELLLQKFPDKTDVFIDPGVDNPKAIHVYEKAGFYKLEEFIPEWEPSCPCVLMHLKIESLRRST
ncbi:MAG: GNAT family N-acetyltransferase [Chlamydiia bacterium]|nr:GNAT family N-acetyltransferase [Chlamydiia bacterium]MCP5509983.1 GNAT family N-acetyltransferase [Chlamydiales bacterium]